MFESIGIRVFIWKSTDAALHLSTFVMQGMQLLFSYIITRPEFMGEEFSDKVTVAKCLVIF